MPNIRHRNCGLHAIAEQINNMTDYERCSLFGLIIKIVKKFVTQQKREDIRKKSRHLCKATIFLTQTANTIRNSSYSLYVS